MVALVLLCLVRAEFSLLLGKAAENVPEPNVPCGSFEPYRLVKEFAPFIDCDVPTARFTVSNGDE